MSLLKRTAPAAFPVKVVQFGEGNFLRAFIDWMIHTMNKQGKFNGMVQIIQPLERGMGDLLNEQDGLYTLFLRGMENGKVVEKHEIIESVKGCINPYRNWADAEATFRLPTLEVLFSNTTEAGIEFKEEPYTPGKCQNTYPAKLTSLMYERFKAGLPGLLLLPCELIDKNGIMLKKCILSYAKLWNLPEAFAKWIEEKNTFCSTLVDRIVAGYPKNDAAKMEAMLGYEDKLLDCGEVFHFFVVEGLASIEKILPFREAGLNVIITDNQTPYRTRKVRFLNGAHTADVLSAILCDLTFVDEMMKDPDMGKMVRNAIYNEIFPTVSLPDEEKKFFADSVVERFENPFAAHRLLSISLNSVSKWKVRVLPSLLDYIKIRNALPRTLGFSLAALLRFYMIELNGTAANGFTDKGTYPVSDSPEVLSFFAEKYAEFQQDCDFRKFVEASLAKKEFWEMDLNTIPGLTDYVTEKLRMIFFKGMRQAVQSIL